MTHIINKKKLILKVTTIIALGLIYAIIHKTTGIGIPCMFRKVTGFYCPGCGITHMCMALLRLDVYTAFRCNIVIMLLLPFWLILLSQVTKKYISQGSYKLTKNQNTFILISIIILIIFGIIRNIPGMEYLNYRG